MDDKQITLQVDGRELRAHPGAMLIEVTDAAGIAIPRFCYHKKLSVAASCRMCLVEVEKAPKPLPACATPVTDGMKVFTHSPKALAAQKSTLEFLLINHPLDCPICDQGGECELQDVALGYGRDASRYIEEKRAVFDPDLGSLIATNMTRCIHCTRCVRFSAEIAGMRELGATGRGEHMRIGTYVVKSLEHELSGNIIDLCPVGALTAKPSRFQARPWELVQSNSIASHDGVGTNVHLHVRRGQLIRVHPRTNEAINETWIADRERFSYQGLSAPDRLGTPLIREYGQWRTADWDEALQWAAQRLQAVMEHDPSQLATLLSPRATLEEMYLAQRLTRGLGSPHIDCRLRQQTFSDAADPLFPWLGLAIADLERVQAILVIGANPRKEQPLLAHRLRKAVMAGAKVVFVNPLHLELTHPATQFVAAPSDLRYTLAGLARALGVTPPALVADTPPDAQYQAAAQDLRASGKCLVLLGNLAAAMADYTALKALAQVIAEAIGATLGYLPAAANSTGAALAGALPQVLPGAQAATLVGDPAIRLWSQPRRAYLLLGFEPDRDVIDPALTQASLAQAETVVALTAWRTPALEATAEVLLPIAEFAETAGTYVNGTGLWQSFQGAIAPFSQARPAWKVLRVLGNLLGLDGFNQVSAADVCAELQVQCTHAVADNTPRAAWAVDTAPGAPNPDSLQRIGALPLYAADPLVRRAPALQQTKDAATFGVWLHPSTAAQRGLAAGDQVTVAQPNTSRVAAKLQLDPNLPAGCVGIPAGSAASGLLGAAFGWATLEKI